MKPEDYDRITVELILALYQAASTKGTFWQGAAASAIEETLAEAKTVGEAITILAPKLRVPALRGIPAKIVVELADEIDSYTRWSNHVKRNLLFILARANVESSARYEAAQKAREERRLQQEQGPQDLADDPQALTAEEVETAPSNDDDITLEEQA